MVGGCRLTVASRSGCIPLSEVGKLDAVACESQRRDEAEARSLLGELRVALAGYAPQLLRLGRKNNSQTLSQRLRLCLDTAGTGPSDCLLNHAKSCLIYARVALETIARLQAFPAKPARRQTATRGSKEDGCKSRDRGLCRGRKRATME